MLLVVCNFTDHDTEMSVEELPAETPECLISNYGDPAFRKVLRLRPYEAVVWKF